MTTLIGENAGWSKRARGSTRERFSPSRALGGVWALQRDRWILWLPVAMIAGAAAWMLSRTDPAWWLGPLLFLLGAAAGSALQIWPGEVRQGWLAAGRTILVAVFALAGAAGLGATAAQVRAASVAGPAYVGGADPVQIEGWVVANNAGERGPRLRLLVRAIEGAATPPRYVRVSVGEAGLLQPGRAARCRAVIGAPAAAMAPGAYDFARRAYFERLGATGFAYGRCRPAEFGVPPDWLDRQRLMLAALRADLSASIQTAAPGRGGAIAAALISGDRSAVDAETNEVLFNAGLGHLLSVSGIHMSIVGGLVFALLLWTGSLIAPIALRWPVKKIAAVGALLAVGAYLLISGVNVPALRSFIMAAVAFGAILLDRPAISMRGLALAAAIVVLLFPESVLDASFQMSFAATTALVALFEILSRPREAPALPTPGPIIGLMQWSTRAVGAVLLISLVAGTATDPFAIYHFQRFSTYALPANLLAEPILSFLVAPAAIIAGVLAPFGWAELPLQVMASGLDLIAAIGETFGTRPEAVRAMPKPPDDAFLLCVVALLWACLWRGGLRWLAVPMFLASVALYLGAARPVAAFDSELRAVYVQEEGRWTLLSAGGRSTYARDRLGAMLGLAPAQTERLAPPEACSESVCRWRLAGEMLFVVSADAGFETACERRAIVLTSLAAPLDYAERCGTAQLVDAESLASLGGGFLYARDGDIIVTRTQSRQFQRPWTPRGVVQE